MTDWQAEYNAAMSDPRKARVITGAGRWVGQKLWVRDARAAGLGPLPWPSFEDWANSYWPGGWDAFRVHPDRGKIHLAPGNVTLTFALLNAGVAAKHVLDPGLVQWAEIGQDRAMLTSFAEALGDIEFGDRGLKQARAPWDRNLQFWVPSDWTDYDWRHSVPRAQRVPLTFSTNSAGDSVPNWGWGIQGPSREWLWEKRPDFRVHILRSPFGYPSPFSKFDPRIHFFETRRAWESWRDLQLQLLPIGKAVPVPSYEPEEPAEPEPPAQDQDALQTILRLVTEIHDVVTRGSR